MMEVLELEGEHAPRAASNRATQVLEDGGVVVFPYRPFTLSTAEQQMLDPAISDGRSKNISLDPATAEVSGAMLGEPGRAVLAAMIGRFAATADALLADLTPGYAPALQRRRTSFRPGAIADRALSRRKDDRRLHVDAFPANPTQGRRILRVFANVNPVGEARVWNVGEEDFQATAARFRDHLKVRAGLARIKQAIGITRDLQSPYDQMMQQLHDAAKLSDDYQTNGPRRRLTFPAGSLWVVYTDSVVHAAMTGQHALEQTYLLPVIAMQNEAIAPIRILENLTNRKLDCLWQAKGSAGKTCGAS